MDQQKRYTVELVKDDRIEEFGRCYIPRMIMKQERLASGMIILLSTSIHGEVCYMECNNLIEIHFCCSSMGEAISFKLSYSPLSMFL